MSGSSLLLIKEIFYSIQGESNRVGLPTAFIRLTGCPLRCTYCDTTYAFRGGKKKSIDEIIKMVANYNAKYITVTGGEPLAQKQCLRLLTKLCDLDYQVSLETSGAIDISGVDLRVMKIMDVKAPGSGEDEKNYMPNFEHLLPSDQLKFVLINRLDYQWACQFINKFNLLEKCEILFSPVHGQLPADKLAGWVLQDNLKVRLQIQLHKYLWGNEPGR